MLDAEARLQPAEGDAAVRPLAAALTVAGLATGGGEALAPLSEAAAVPSSRAGACILARVDDGRSVTAMSAFSQAEIEYLTGGRRLARIATVGGDGTPHVVPVGWSYDADLDAIEVGGHELASTKKFRDVRRTGRAAVVIDDLASTDPWRPRGVEVRGRAEAVEQPAPLIRVYPERIVSWGLDDARRARDVSR